MNPISENVLFKETNLQLYKYLISFETLLTSKKLNMSQKEPQNDEIGNPSTFINSANEKTFFYKKYFICLSLETCLKRQGLQFLF